MYEMASTVAAIGPVRHAGASPVVRIPLNDFASASRALDVGAEAVIAPMINNTEQARRFVGAMKYPPVGERSWGPARAAALSGIAELKDYFRDANGMTLALAMIETREAMENVAAIAGTDGIDGLFVGPVRSLDRAQQRGHARSVFEGGRGRARRHPRCRGEA